MTEVCSASGPRVRSAKLDPHIEPAGQKHLALQGPFAGTPSTLWRSLSALRQTDARPDAWPLLKALPALLVFSTMVEVPHSAEPCV